MSDISKGVTVSGSPASIFSVEAMHATSDAQQKAFAGAMQAKVDAANLQSKPEAFYAEISHEEFSTQMQAMQVHYQSFASKPVAAIELFPLPVHLVHPPILSAPEVQSIRLNAVAPIKLNAPSPALHPAIILRPVFTVEGTKVVGDAVVNSHNELLTFINSSAGAIIAAAGVISKSKQKAAATAAFTQQMNAIRDQAKAQYTAKIEALYNTFTNLGKVHPEQRPKILNATNSIGQIFGGILGGVVEVHHQVTTIVTAPVVDVIKIGTSAIQAASSWASGAAQSVGNAFKDVLSLF
jgi:hypothetical protein